MSEAPADQCGIVDAVCLQVLLQQLTPDAIVLVEEKVSFGTDSPGKPERRTTNSRFHLQYGHSAGDEAAEDVELELPPLTVEGKRPAFLTGREVLHDSMAGLGDAA